MEEADSAEAVKAAQRHNVTVSVWLSFACGLRVNVATGEVVIPDGLSLDDASRAFWENLARYHPNGGEGAG